MNDAQIDAILIDLHGMELIAGRCDSGLATEDDGDRLRDIAERMTSCLQWQRTRSNTAIVAEMEASDGG